MTGLPLLTVDPFSWSNGRMDTRLAGTIARRRCSLFGTLGSRIAAEKRFLTKSASACVAYANKSEMSRVANSGRVAVYVKGVLPSLSVIVNVTECLSCELTVGKDGASETSL